MIRIRRVYSTALPIDRQRLDQVQRIFRENFPSVADYAETLADKIDHAFKYGYRTFLLVSEASLGKVTGFSLLLHLPEVNSTVLDVGCGTGLFFSHIATEAQTVVGVDISRLLLLQAKERVRDFPSVLLVQADADHLPFRDACFNVVLAFTVLQNMPKPSETL
ncbi:MAG: methyltransferase domain-containing protein, partial [Acidobacteriota bacterium]